MCPGEPRMCPRTDYRTFLALLGWCCLLLGAGLGEEVSGRNHKLQRLLETLDPAAKEAGLGGVEAKDISSKFQQLHQPPGKPEAMHPDGPTAKVDHPLPHPATSQEPSRFPPDSSSIKSYQDFYKVFYGSQAGIDHLRKKYGPDNLQQARSYYGPVNRGMEDVRQANTHLLSVRRQSRCRLPTAQVVRVKDHYPDPSREYLPRCTLLHRCSDATGCCDSDALRCVPSAVQEVVLHFYALTVGRHGLGGQQASSNIEKLLFENHTACHCQPINDLPRIQEHPDPLDGKDAPVDDKAKSKCRECPVPFTSRTYRDGRCGCDCFDRQKPCLRIKRGREPLTDIERRCVEANHCHIPDCEHGLYDHRTGYCPKRHDEDKQPSHQPTSHPHRNNGHRHSASHRWAFIERD